VFADQSDKWHHSICRYLGLSSDTFFLFGVIPGVCREVIGRRDFMYTQPECFNSKLVYSFSEHHHNKLSKSKSVRSYYGTCPFLWDLGLTAIKKEYNPKGSLFFLPRDDQVTIREQEWKSVQDVINTAPKPITFLLPWRDVIYGNTGTNLFCLMIGIGYKCLTEKIDNLFYQIYY